MCGIIGVLGKSEASPSIIETLRRLEYRGYDSAGIATLDCGAITSRRAVGKLSELEAVVKARPVSGTIGIGHTRWATHGSATENNAHPHIAGPVAVVHNGIIENFRELRDELTAKGANFSSETDTEVVARLCAYFISEGKNAKDAVASTLARLTGAFALAFLFEGEDDLLIAARRGSPLAIGHGDGEMFIGSDAMALAPVTNRITYLEEGDCAVLTRAGADIFDALGNPADRAIRVVNVDQIMVDKGEHRHFMLKEIHEQPSVTAFALSHYLNPERTAINLPESDIDFSQFDRIVLVACGTAHYACAVAKYWFEKIARIPVEIDVASEFRYREPPMNGRECVMFISQSGETADTLAALRYVQGKVASIVAIVNVAESSISREADFSLLIMAGPEISVASTKAFTCQLTVLACLAILAGRQHGTVDQSEEKRLIDALMSAPRLIGEAINSSADLNIASRELAKAQDILFLGRGSLFPLAMEGALKLKELSYIHAEGFPSGELKHGPIALVDDSVPVIVFTPSGGLFEKTVSNMEEVMARGGKILLITDEDGAATASSGVWHTVLMPKVDPFIAPIVYAVPAQLLAYHTAVEKGTDVDQPRNLAKSVTVE
ncbi:glutamine--fructose-6-phosphate aminotransferase [Rhodobacterales bacterium 52_120_T64]|nr:glutamine--fructose-6-phosphate aminotransferase [Rhodobacterales bacterium 52_120_T64]